MQSKLYLVLIFFNMINKANLSPDANYSSMIQIEFYDIKIKLAWDINLLEQNILFKVSTSSNINKSPVNILIGFSDHGSIAGSDFCMYKITDNISRLYDGWIDKKNYLYFDLHNDCEFIDNNNKIYENEFRFRRKFVTCDLRDYAFEFGTTNILTAVGYKSIKFIDETKKQSDIYYKMSYTQILNKQKNVNEQKRYAHDLQTLEIRGKNIKVPAQVTTYWCQTIKLEPYLINNKHHILEYEAVISKGMENIVHHFEVFHCRKPVILFAGFCNNAHSKPKNAKSCSKVIAAWAMGAQKIIYPNEAGMPLGGKNFVPYLMIEIHYNNPEKRTNLIDNSGIRLKYTKNLRKNDAAIMEVGFIYSDANSIPPKQSNFPLTAYCVEDCTNKFPSNGISVFATQLHTHLTGRKLFTSHFRRGVKIGEINRDNHFSPHWQYIKPLKKHIKIYPGDVLSTTCVFNTKKRTNWTWGGYGINDEMCVNYLHYYPASKVEVCKSAIDNSTLHSLFKKLGVNNKKLKINEKYLAVNWTEAKINILKEYYHVSSLNVACFNHAGELFKNHPTNWQKVKRPKTISGIYTRTRSNDECFAIND